MTKEELNECYDVMFTEFPDIMSVKDVQNALGIGKHLVYDLISDGSIKALLMGNKYRIPKINLIKYALNN